MPHPDPTGLAHLLDGDPAVIADVPRVRAILIAAAAAGEAVSYSRFLAELGLRFTRPRMRSLCRTLDRIDAEAALAGEPELAVLVVRESDGLPGQGWWTGHAAETGYAGAWTGPEAVRVVRRLQNAAFRHWQEMAARRPGKGGGTAGSGPSARRGSRADGSQA